MTTTVSPETEVIVPPMSTTSTHMLHVLDHTGDTKTMWDPAVQAEVDAAKKTFSRLKKQGYLAYTVDDEGEKGEVISDFNPLAGKIIMVPQLVGG